MAVPTPRGTSDDPGATGDRGRPGDSGAPGDRGAAGGRGTADGRGTRGGPGNPAVPPELAELLFAQLERVADEVEEEVCRQVPEYARPADGTYRRNLRAGVVQALTLFIDHIADPGGQGASIAATYYELGRGEALEGRSLDALQSALRVGGLHAWRLMGRTAE